MNKTYYYILNLVEYFFFEHELNIHRIGQYRNRVVSQRWHDIYKSIRLIDNTQQCLATHEDFSELSLSVQSGFLDSVVVQDWCPYSLVACIHPKRCMKSFISRPCGASPSNKQQLCHDEVKQLIRARQHVWCHCYVMRC